MEKTKTKSKTGDAKKVRALVAKLNQYRHEYYNLAAPSVSDAVYDRLYTCLLSSCFASLTFAKGQVLLTLSSCFAPLAFAKCSYYDELQELEKKTCIIYGNSPTQTVGCAPVSSLEKVRHPIPLPGLDKTKQTGELQQMSDKAAALLMLKLDGLTIKLCYEGGELVEASTRGDGDMGELITHNIPVFCNVPLKIPYEGRLVITGEGVIHNDDFEKLKDMAAGSGDKEICNARNLAAGSIRLLNPSACKERHIYFYAFSKCRFVLASNYYPMFSDRALEDRMLVIPLPKSLREDEINRNLLEDIKNDMQAVLRQIMDELREFITGGYEFADIGELEFYKPNYYSNCETQASRFFYSRCYCEEGSKLTRDEMYAAFCAFCDENEMREISKEAFEKQFKPITKEHGIRDNTNGGKGRRYKNLVVSGQDVPDAPREWH